MLIFCNLALMLAFIHFMDLKDDEYIGYFHKFERRKNNAGWHVISSIFTIGAVCAGIISVMLWNEN